MPRSFAKLALAAGALAVTCAPAIAQTLPAPAAAAARPAVAPVGVTSDRSYTLGAGDVVDIILLGRTDFNTRARIGSDGAIVLPLLGAVPAEGRTPADLGSQIASALEKGGFYSNPQVRVDVVGVSSRYVTVLGAVGTPGLIPLDRTYRLSEILARVGGRAGGGADYVVLTRPGAPSRHFKMDALATGGPAEDPQVEPGDKIYVPGVENVVFYISGEVKAPGAFPLTDTMTIRMALARAGGLSEQGSEGRIKLYRGGKELPHVSQETKIEPGDVITVGARLF